MADLLEDRTLQNQAYEGDLDAVKAAVESAESAKAVATRKDSDGRTLLHWAASGGRMDVVDYLMTIEGVKVNSRDESQWTPLMSAAAAGHVAVAAKLLDAGADANLANDSGKIPLHYHKGSVAIIDLLLPHTKDVDAKRTAVVRCQDKAGSTPLARTAGPGFTEAARALLGAGADPNIADRYGNMPLHLAVEEHQDPVAVILVENGAKLDVENGEKQTPLSMASTALRGQMREAARASGGGAAGAGSA